MKPFDLLLFEIPGPQQRRFVCRLPGVECLSAALAADAVAAFETAAGWVSSQQEILGVGGNPEGLCMVLMQSMFSTFASGGGYRNAVGQPIDEGHPLHRINRYALCSRPHRASGTPLAWSVYGIRSISVAEYQRTVKASATFVAEHARLQVAPPAS